MSKHQECPESLNGEHDVTDVEIESSTEDSTILTIHCVHCDASGKLEIEHADIEWVREDDDEEVEDDDPLREAEDED